MLLRPSHRAPFARARPPRILLIGLSVVLGIIAGLLGCELGLRVRGKILYGLHNPAGSSLFVRDARTGLRVPRAEYHLRGTRTDIRINSHGFRGEEIASVKPPGGVRIACIGASATFCRESSTNAATWPARLEAALRAAYPDLRIEVINAGVPGYVLETARKNLVQRVLPLDPDIVIVCETNNDMAEDTRRLAEERGLIPARGSKRSLWGIITRSSMLADFCSKNYRIATRGGALPARARVTTVPAELPRRYIALLAEMHALLRERSIRLVLSTNMVKYRREQDRERQIANADATFYYMPWMSIDALLDASELYNKAIVDFADANGIPVAAGPAIPADDTHFTDCMHLTDEGSRVMAERFFNLFIAKGIVDSLKSRQPAPA